MGDAGYHQDPDDRTVIYILYIEKATLLAPGYSNTPVLWYWFADAANHCSHEYGITSNAESNVAYYAFMVISFQDMSQRSRYLTLTLSTPAGEHLCVAWLDLQTLNVDESGRLDVSGNFASQVVDLQTSEGAVFARADLHTGAMQRWTRDVPLTPSLEPAFMDPRSDAQAEYLYTHFTGAAPQQDETAHASDTAAAAAAEEEERRQRAVQEEAERQRIEDERRREEEAAARDRHMQEQERLRRMRDEDEFDRRRRADEGARDFDRGRRYGLYGDESERDLRLREQEWERQRQREREVDERERARLDQEERSEQQYVRERRYFEDIRNILPRAGQDWQSGDDLQGPHADAGRVDEESDPCEFVEEEEEDPGAGKALRPTTTAATRGRRASPRGPGQAYTRPAAPLAVRLDQLKALGVHSEPSLYLVHSDDTGEAPTTDDQQGFSYSSDAAASSSRGRRGQRMPYSSASRALTPTLEAGVQTKADRRSTAEASPVHAALATALADVAGQGAVPGAATEECVLRLLVLQRNLNASKAADRSALKDAAAGVVPRMLQVLEAARETCERNQARLEALSKERGVDIEKLGGGAGYLQPQLRAIAKLQAQYSSLLSTPAAPPALGAASSHAATPLRSRMGSPLLAAKPAELCPSARPAEVRSLPDSGRVPMLGAPMLAAKPVEARSLLDSGLAPKLGSPFIAAKPAEVRSFLDGAPLPKLGAPLAAARPAEVRSLPDSGCAPMLGAPMTAAKPAEVYPAARPMEARSLLDGGRVPKLGSPLTATKPSEVRSLPDSGRVPKPPEDKYLKILRNLQAKSGSGGGLLAKLLNSNEGGSLKNAPAAESKLAAFGASRSRENLPLAGVRRKLGGGWPGSDSDGTEVW